LALVSMVLLGTVFYLRGGRKWLMR
jgi:hypothetical protein